MNDTLRNLVLSLDLARRNTNREIKNKQKRNTERQREIERGGYYLKGVDDDDDEWKKEAHHE